MGAGALPRPQAPWVGAGRTTKGNNPGSSITNIEDDRGGKAGTTRSFTSFRMTEGGRGAGLLGYQALEGLQGYEGDD